VVGQVEVRANEVTYNAVSNGIHRFRFTHALLVPRLRLRRYNPVHACMRSPLPHLFAVGDDDVEVRAIYRCIIVMILTLRQAKLDRSKLI
jgi:hypothetical protein